MMNLLQLRCRGRKKHKRKPLKLIQDFQDPWGSPVELMPWKQGPGERKSIYSGYCFPPEPDNF